MNPELEQLIIEVMEADGRELEGLPPKVLSRSQYLLGNLPDKLPIVITDRYGG